MSDVVFRQGKFVSLRPLERVDVPVLRRWINDPKVTQFLVRAMPFMEKEEEEWVDALSGSKTNYVLGIVELSEKKLIGSVGLHGVDWQHRVATTGIIIGEKEYWGRGYGAEAVMLLLDYALNALDLHSVLSYVFANNKRSLACHKKCGYEEVLWRRQQDGSRGDDVLLVVAQEKWRPFWQKYLAERDS